MKIHPSKRTRSSDSPQKLNSLQFAAEVQFQSIA